MPDAPSASTPTAVAPPSAARNPSGSDSPGPGGPATSPSSPGSSAASDAPSTPGEATLDPTALLPGTNHNRAANAYVHRAKDVHTWLVKGPKAKGYPTTKIAFLTFDDGPTNSTTPAVLKILKSKKVPATFFYIAGPSALKTADPALVHQTIAEGHSVTVHSYSHNYKLLYPGGVGNARAIIGDRDKALNGIRAVLGQDYTVHGFRYPGGHMSWRGLQAADQALAQDDAWWIDWNAIDGDGQADAPSTSAGAARLVHSTLAANGNPNVAVVLMHDFQHNQLTVGALPTIIDDLRAQGYEFGVID